MINFRKLTATTAILSVSAFMSSAALAEGDMTCAEFNALDADGQNQAAMTQGPKGGLDQAKDKARGADGTEAEMSTSDTVEANTDSGQEGQQTMARGGDVVQAVMDHCSQGDELLVKDARHPGEVTPGAEKKAE